MRMFASPALLLALALTPISFVFGATSAFAAETCNNGTDDDADGLADCADPDCSGNAACRLDADGDGYGASSLGGSDCNDSSASVHPGATEYCNGVDDNCNGRNDDAPVDGTVYYRDSDSDGYGSSSSPSAAACSAPSGYVSNSSDCDDSRNAIYPGAAETCNSRDDDCDGSVDEGLSVTLYRDADADGYGNPSSSVVSCSSPSGYVTNATDCDDTRNSVNPGHSEFCDALDNDCDGSIDEGVGTTYYADVDGDTYGDPSSSTVSCSLPSGYVANSGDCLDTDVTVNPRGTETCNGLDDDCNGVVDDVGGHYWYEDSDGDGWGNPDVGTFSCTTPSGYSRAPGDCDDTNAAIHPEVTEICDGVDDDCDGLIDEDGGTTWYRDVDGDGYGNAAQTNTSCTAPSGYVALSTDCNDANSAIYPGAPEVCNGYDDDCDGAVDDGAGTTYYADNDHDNYGDPASAVTACSRPSGYITDGSDCDDTQGSVHPGGTETCNGMDDDCNGSTDDGIGSTWYRDSDGDGYGDHSVTTRNCSAPAGYVADNLDCNDTNSGIYPGATEFCNGIDDDCNSLIDDDAYDVSNWYQDLDSDGYGNSAVSTLACSAPSGYVGRDGDCWDDDSSVNPGAPELADGVDQNCDGIVDETTTNYDDDGDGYAETGGDCNDAADDMSPVGTETCDGRDEDCDGVVDNGTSCYDDDGDGFSEDDGDCNDGDAAVSPSTTEVAENGVDDDCDGAVDTGTYDPDEDGYTRDGGDCGESDAATYPGATEISDGVDNDCDGVVDEGTDAYDDDGDGMTEDAGDCDDSDVTIYDGAAEDVDGKDNDCDGFVDEGGDNTDDDGDGYSEDQGDCDDTNADTNPSLNETLDDLDNNCNGSIDEGLIDADADGYTTEQGDCDDNDGWAFPDAFEYCDSIDNDCDGAVDNGCDTAEEIYKNPGVCGCAVDGGSGASLLGVALMVGAALQRRRSK